MHENIREMVSLKVGVRLVFFYFLFIFRDTSTRYCNDSAESFNFWRKLGRKLKESLQRDSIWWKESDGENYGFSLSLSLYLCRK